MSLLTCSAACGSQPSLVCGDLKVFVVATRPVLDSDKGNETAPRLLHSFLSDRSEEIELVGPVLGSMDSPDVALAMACTVHGVEISQEIVRSAAFNGDTAKNAAWRPHAVVRLSGAAGATEVIARWTMRLTDGTEVTLAFTPAYPPQRFPVQLVRRLPSRSSR